VKAPPVRASLVKRRHTKYLALPFFNHKYCQRYYIREAGGNVFIDVIILSAYLLAK